MRCDGVRKIIEYDLVSADGVFEDAAHMRSPRRLVLFVGAKRWRNL